MVQIAKLVASLFANTSEFEAGMKRASKQWRDFKKESGEAAKFASVGLLGVATALSALAIRQAHVIDGQAKLARSIGSSLEKFQALNLVAGEAGVDQEKLVAALRKTQVALFNAASGGKEAQSSFKALGLNVSELLKLSVDKQFEEIAKSLEAIKNPAERSALALKIFGKAGGDIIPMLEDFAAKQKEAEEFTRKFNISLSEVDANKVEEANDAVGRVGQAVGGLGNTIAVELSPYVTEFSNRLLDSVGDAEIWANAIRDAVDFTASSFDVLDDTLTATVGTFLVAAEKIRSNFVQLGLIIKGEMAAARQEAEISQAYVDSIFSDIGKEVNTKSGENFVVTADKNSQRRSQETEQKRKVFGGVGSGQIVSETDGQKKFKESLDALKKENELLQLNISLQGKSDAQKKAALELFKINATFQKEGITLTKAQTLAVQEQIAKNEELETVYEKVAKAEERRKQLSEDLATSIDSAFEDAILKGKSLSSTLRSLAADMLNLIAKAAIKNATSGITSAIGNSIGSFVGSFLPSFAVGTDYVPQDMTANIHQGEMIIPAKEAGMIRSGGLGGNIVQNITIGTNVTTAVRQEIAKALPDIRRATVAAVQDSALRGKTT